MGTQVGLEGASFGTNFSMFLQRMAKGLEMLAMARRGMKSEAQAILKDLGINFDFFDQAGNFKGIEAMAKEQGKLEQSKVKPIRRERYGAALRTALWYGSGQACHVHWLQRYGGGLSAQCANHAQAGRLADTRNRKKRNQTENNRT